MKMIVSISSSMFAFFIVLISCNSGDTLKSQSIDYSTDINLLAKEFKLNGQPISVKWLKYKQGDQSSVNFGPTDYKIVAIVEYNSIDFKKIISSIDTNNTKNDKIFLDPSFVKEWFPESAKNAFLLEDNYLRVKPNAYNIDLFLNQAQGRGFFFFIEDNKVFIYLQRK